jgi:hypothetical protein
MRQLNKRKIYQYLFFIVSCTILFTIVNISYIKFKNRIPIYKIEAQIDIGDLSENKMTNMYTLITEIQKQYLVNQQGNEETKIASLRNERKSLRYLLINIESSSNMKAEEYLEEVVSFIKSLYKKNNIQTNQKLKVLQEKEKEFLNKKELLVTKWKSFNKNNTKNSMENILNIGLVNNELFWINMNLNKIFDDITELTVANDLGIIVDSIKKQDKPLNDGLHFYLKKTLKALVLGFFLSLFLIFFGEVIMHDFFNNKKRYGN